MGKGKTKGRSGSTKHTHQYIKVSGKYTPCWRCADADCRHFVYVAQENVIVDRNSICWGCKNKFQMDEDAMKEDMPRCFECRNPELAPMRLNQNFDQITKIKSINKILEEEEDRPESEEN